MTVKIPDKVNILLGLVILAALALRLYLLMANLPYAFWHDENNYIETALRYGAGNFKMTSYSHGGLFQLILFFEYGVYYFILKLAGIVHAPAGFLLRYLADPSVFFIIARLSVILCSVGTIYLVYLICSKLFNGEAALMAAVFAAFSLLMVQVSSLALADMPAVFILLFSFLLLIYSIKRSGGYLLFYCACFLVGLSAACKYYAIFGIVPVYVAAYIKYRALGKKNFSSAFSMFFFGSMLVIAGLLAGIPSLIFSLKELYRDTFIRMGSEFLVRNQPKEAWFISLACHLRNGLGIPLEIAVFSGLSYAVYKHSKWDILLLSFPISYYLLFMHSGGYAYHLLPAVPFTLILAARFIDVLTKKIFSNGSLITCTILSLALTTPTFIDSVKFAKIMSGRDTRIEAKVWTEKNIPEDANILAEGYVSTAPIFTPPLTANLETLNRDLERNITLSGGFLTKMKIADFERLYLNGKKYDIYKVYRMSREDAKRTGPLYVFLTEAGDTKIVAESAGLSTEDYLSRRGQLERYLSDGYELEKTFIPSRAFTMMFPHLTGPDYKLIRDTPMGALDDFVKGPKVDIYRRR